MNSELLQVRSEVVARSFQKSVININGRPCTVLQKEIGLPDFVLLR